MEDVGRNDPCPCGSGKKYKKCCSQKSPLQRHQFTNLNPDGVKSSIGRIAGMVSQTLRRGQKESEKTQKSPASSLDTDEVIEETKEEEEESS